MTDVSFKELDVAVDEACTEFDRPRAEKAELLQFLRKWVYQRHLHSRDDVDSFREEGRAVIAKAEGRS